MIIIEKNCSTKYVNMEVRYTHLNQLKKGRTLYEELCPALKRYFHECNPYSCKPNYPGKDCKMSFDPDLQCTQFGYQPRMRNPGSKLFFQYDYPFQTQFGLPYSNKGDGWYHYNTTGRMPL